jgi:hypothetical protein
MKQKRPLLLLLPLVAITIIICITLWMRNVEAPNQSPPNLGSAKKISIPFAKNLQQGRPIRPPAAANSNIQKTGDWHADFTKLDDNVKRIRIANSLLDSSDKINATAARLLELTEQERGIAEDAIAASFSRARELMLNNMREAKTNEMAAFEIVADPGNAERLINELSTHLRSGIGETKGLKVLNSLNLWAYYGGFGLLDGRLEFKSSTLGNPAANEPTYEFLSCQIEMRNPENGAVLLSGGYQESDLAKYFGKNTFRFTE